MISIKKQHQLFGSVTTYLEEINFKFPIFNFTENCEKKDHEEDIFDTLGFFSCNSPDNIYLCLNNINDYSLKNNLNPNLVAEIIAIHEISHFVHFWSIGKELFCKNNDLFYESFAQLLTHKVCQDNSEEHLKCFEKLKEGQSSVYTDYHSKKIDYIGLPISFLPWNIHINSFINIKEVPDDLYSITIENLEKYLLQHYPLWWTSYASDIEDKNNIEKLVALGSASIQPILSCFEKKYPNVLDCFIR